MSRRIKLPRDLKSKMMANLILKNDLKDEWILFRYSHPKIKSNYKLGSLFCSHRKLRWVDLESPLPIFEVNMDTILEF